MLWHCWRNHIWPRLFYLVIWWLHYQAFLFKRYLVISYSSGICRFLIASLSFLINAFIQNLFCFIQELKLSYYTHNILLLLLRYWALHFMISEWTFKIFRYIMINFSKHYSLSIILFLIWEFHIFIQGLYSATNF